MKKTTAAILVATTLLLAGCCTTPHTAKWEYKIENAMKWTVKGEGPDAWRETYQSHLNELGKEGWVLIEHHDYVFYFKRAIK